MEKGSKAETGEGFLQSVSSYAHMSKSTFEELKHVKNGPWNKISQFTNLVLGDLEDYKIGP